MSRFADLLSAQTPQQKLKQRPDYALDWDVARVEAEIAKLREYDFNPPEWMQAIVDEANGQQQLEETEQPSPEAVEEPPRFKYGANKNLPFKRLKRALVRVAADPVKLEKEYQGILRWLDVQAEHKIYLDTKYKRTPDISSIRSQQKAIKRLYLILQRKLQGVIETRNRIFSDCTPEEREAKMNAILLIPMAEFRHFDRLSPNEQENKLATLIEQHGKVSGNGFSKNLLNIPGWASPHFTGDLKETDGSNRRPQFVHEMIDRIIYAALHPASFRDIFFRPTDFVDSKRKKRKKCQRWNAEWRQIRSEGRMGIVRVLMVLLPAMDFKASLRAGKRSPDGTFKGIPIEQIAEAAGMSRQSVNTALKTLVDNELLYRGKQAREQYQETDEDGKKQDKWKGLPVVRRFSEKLISALGLGKRWLIERNKAQNGGKKPSKEMRKLIDEIDSLSDELTSSEYTKRMLIIEAKMRLAD